MKNTIRPQSLKAFIKLSFPNIISNLAAPIAGLIDLAVLGHLQSVTPFAGVNLAAIIFSYLYWGFGFLRMSTTTYSSQALGRQDHQERLATFFRGLAIALIIATIILILQDKILDFSLQLLEGQSDVKLAAQNYYLIRVWAAPAVLSLYVIQGWLVGSQLPQEALKIALLQNLTNIIGSITFVSLLGWNESGAAFSTALSSWLAALFGLWLIYKNRPTHHLVTIERVFRLKALRQLFQLNGYIMVRTLFLIGVMTSFTNIASSYGENELASTGLLMQLLLFGSYFIDGFAYALESLIGEAKGKRDNAVIKQHLKEALICSTLTALSLTGLYWVGGRNLITLFNQHPAVVNLSEHYLTYLCFILLLGSGSYIYDGLYIGIGQGKVLCFSMVLAVVVGYYPQAVFAYKQGGLTELWQAMTLFMLLRLVLLAGYTSWSFRRLNFKKKTTSLP